MSSATEETTKKSPQSGSTSAQTATKALKAFAESSKCPAQVKPYLEKAIPFIAKGIQAAEDAVPHVVKFYKLMVEYSEKLKPYKLHLLLPSIFGLVMCFFGGSYLTLIAAWEAFLLCGYDTTIGALYVLYDNLMKVAEANKKDNEKDDDGNGVPDVLEVSNSELLQRKAFLFLKTADPNKITLAIAGINAGFLAVVATLKLQFAKTITLGNAIGSAIQPPADEFLVPKLEQAIAPEYRKWVKPLVSYAIRSFAISIAWFVQRIISAFHSAIRGGLMFSRNILKYLSEMNIYHLNHEDTVLDEIVGYAMAALGLWFQLSLGFSVPFPLNILLFPFTLVEYFLMWMVAK